MIGNWELWDLTLLPVFNKSISVLVAPCLARHCHRSLPHQTRMSIIYQSGPRCGGGGGADPGSRQIGLGNNNTHYNHGAPAVFPTSRESALQQVSEYYYRWIETLKILRHHLAFLRSRDQGLCCSCGWSRPSDPNRHRLGSLVTLGDNKVDGKVLAVGILPLNISIKLTFRAKNSST